MADMRKPRSGLDVRAISKREQEVMLDLLRHHAWHTSRVVKFQDKDGKPRRQLRFVVRSQSFVEISPYILRSLQSRELLGDELGTDGTVTRYHLTDLGRSLARLLALEAFVTDEKESTRL